MYYIYHIPGVKIGCSINPKQRVKRKGYTEYEILEQWDNIDKASEREIELQKQYGYQIDNILYKRTINAPTKDGMKKAGEWSVKSGHLKKISSLGGKVQGSKNLILNYVTKETLSMGGKAGLKKQCVELICPKCGKVGVGRAMYRWHFDKCRI
jgi:predicted RNA-binding Zn-ribbon protein involved in translation (DUF1610 family)